MALHAVVENLDGIPDALKTEYKEVKAADGKVAYHLDLTSYDGHSAIRPLKDEAARQRIAARDAAKAAEKYKVFGERDPTEILTLLDRIPELEAAATAGSDPAKIETLVETKLRTKLAPVERERDTLKTQITELTGKLTQAQEREVRRELHDNVREAIKKQTGFQETAVDDVLMLAERVFERNDDGKFSVKDGMGATPGSDLGSWLTEMQPKRPHWWGTTQGAGARGNAGGAGGAGGPNPFSAEGWNLTQQGQLIMTDRKRAEALATQAGTVIGGARPKTARK